MKPLKLHNPLADRAEIASAINLLCPPDTCVELRALEVPKGGTASGYFDGQHRDELIDAATELSGQASGVYITLNPVDPTVMARSYNRVKKFVKATTGDSEILRRIWLPIDFDAKRPPGVSSTHAEHDAALNRARECREFLRGQGWPESILADSGNGAHVLCRIDLPNDRESLDLLKEILRSLVTRFDDEAVEVDPKVINASRIWKLYGTLAAKGDHTPDRPHRIARILEVSSHVQ